MIRARCRLPTAELSGDLLPLIFTSSRLAREPKCRNAEASAAACANAPFKGLDIVHLRRVADWQALRPSVQKSMLEKSFFRRINYRVWLFIERPVDRLSNPACSLGTGNSASLRVGCLRKTAPVACVAVLLPSSLQRSKGSRYRCATVNLKKPCRCALGTSLRGRSLLIRFSRAVSPNH